MPQVPLKDALVAATSAAASTTTNLSTAYTTFHQFQNTSTCVDTCLRNWKITFALFIFFEGLVFGYVVYLIRRFTSQSCRSFNLAIHFGHALSAGVFFATGMLHILPEAIELLSSGEDHPKFARNGLAKDGDTHDISFPWPFFIVIVGFYALFFLEKILVPMLASVSAGNINSEEATSLMLSTISTDSELRTPILAYSTVDTDPDIHSPFLEHRFLSSGFLIALMQILGLSAHSLFESIALGLSSDFSTVLNVFIATAAHRWATSIAIAFTCAAKLGYRPFIVAYLLFSSMVPFGVALGMILRHLSTQAQGILFSLSAATFLYIGVFETMADEFILHREMIGLKFVTTLVGAGIIVVTTAILVSLGIQG